MVFVLAVFIVVLMKTVNFWWSDFTRLFQRFCIYLSCGRKTINDDVTKLKLKREWIGMKIKNKNKNKLFV